MHPPQERVRDCGPRTLPLHQLLEDLLGGELERHHQHQRGGQPPTPKRQRPDRDHQRHRQDPQVLGNQHRAVQPAGQPIDGVEHRPLGRADPPVSDNDRTDGEYRQAGRQHDQVAPDPPRDISPLFSARAAGRGPNRLDPGRKALFTPVSIRRRPYTYHVPTQSALIGSEDADQILAHDCATFGQETTDDRSSHR
jgi:hypothetical protein